MMQFKRFHRAGVMFIAAGLATAGAAHAQTAGWQSFVSVTPAYQSDADLDGGGDYDALSVIVFAGASGDLGNGNRAGVTLNFSHTDYSFSNPVDFGGTAPWDAVQRYGMSAPFSFGLNDGWSLGLTPTIDWFRETGADMEDSLSWGGVVSATKRFDDGNRLGFGAIMVDRIEETSVFPFLLVDWRIGERWRLLNPLPAGPTGPAGLELDYRFDSGWSLGLGAAWRSTRFRLSTDGAAPNGVGEEEGLPVFLRATRAIGEQTSLHLYAGLVFEGKLRVEDASGHELKAVDFDPAPLFGATFLTRF